MSTHRAIVVLSVFLTLVAHTSAQQTSSWRPTIVAEHGMVAAGHPLAAEAGMRILKAGGNAVDAAIATWAVQGQVEPGMTGLGADMFVMIYLAQTGEVKFINGTGFAAKAATIDFYKSKGGIPEDGPLSISVPGAVGGAALVGHPDQVAQLDAGVGDHVLVVGDLPGEPEQAGVGAVEAVAHGGQLVLHVGEGLLGGEELR